MLHDKKLVAFIATAKPDQAKRFYTDTLGLVLIREDAFALTYETETTMLRIQKVQGFTPQPFTALGWEVPDMDAMVRGLGVKGVHFEQFGLSGQDQRGVWTAPGGTKVAWFKDPDGNVLSISALG
jgi:catechol 2,3-dioxygenase-like lactoylglutathione lyase family enzyme